MPRLSPRSRYLLATQRDVIGRWQMTAGEARAASRAARMGTWQMLTNHVYLATRSAPTDEQRMWAAVLHGGPEARLAGRNALTLHGWSQPIAAPFDIVIPRSSSRRLNPPWLKVHHDLRLAGPPQSPARVDVHEAVVQSAAWARTDREAMFIVISALQQRLVTAPRVLLTVRPNTRRRGLIAFIIGEFLDGVDSLNELDFGSLCRRFGVPQPTRQTRILDSTGKCRSIDVEFETWDGRILHVEIEGMHHLDPETYLDDIDRHNSLALTRRKPYLRVFSYTLRFEPAVFMAQLRTEVVGQNARQAS